MLWCVKRGLGVIVHLILKLNTPEYRRLWRYRSLLRDKDVSHIRPGTECFSRLHVKSSKTRESCPDKNNSQLRVEPLHFPSDLSRGCSPSVRLFKTKKKNRIFSPSILPDRQIWLGHLGRFSAPNSTRNNSGWYYFHLCDFICLKCIMY